jgi:hypothetical protein
MSIAGAARGKLPWVQPMLVPRRNVRLSLAVTLSACIVGSFGACHSSASLSPPPSASPPEFPDAAPYAQHFYPLDSDGHVLRDAQGRTVILRGYNVKASGLFDVTPDDGEPDRETIPLLDDTDFGLMQKAGVNVLRLPVNWSAFEPQRGQYQSSYLDAIAAFLDRVRPYGFYVLLDFHEDGWSKDLCEDGAPAWATIVTDWTEGGASGDCHVSNAALSAHSSFFDKNTNDLQGAFIAMYQQFAARFVNEDLVMGYEIFNEPIASDEVVDAFSIKAAQAIRQVDPRHLIVWEPSVLRNFTNSSLVSNVPFPVAGGVYAVHIYTTVASQIAISVENARTEADSWGEPLFVTEHGANALPDGGIAWVDDLLDGFDQTRAASVDWIWNPGVITRDDAGAVDYVFDGGVYDHLTRPYAMAIGGDVDAVTWDGTKLAVTFRDHAGVPAKHDIYWNRPVPSVTCDGVKVLGVGSDATRLVFHVACGGSAVPDGGDHALVFSSAP